MPRIKYTKKGSRLLLPHESYIPSHLYGDCYGGVLSTDDDDTPSLNNCSRTNNIENLSVFKPSQSSHGFQPVLRREYTAVKRNHDIYANTTVLQSTTVASTTPNLQNNKNCLKDTSGSCEEENTSDEDCQQDQNCPSHSKKDSSIKDAKFCDVDSESKETEDCPSHSQFGNETCTKREPCDMNIDCEPSTSKSTKGIKSRSDSFERCNGTCSCEADDSSSSATVVESKNEKPDAENSADSPPNQDQKRSRRNSKRKRDVEDHCPVCSLTIRCSDLESHFTKEVENLDNIARNVRRHRPPYKPREGFKCGVNLGYLQAKNNREKRIEARKAKYLKQHEICCPVCKIQISGNDEEINEHVLACFGEDEDSDINVTDYGENIEEYEIGNETRIRAISLVPGGHSSLHGYSSNSKPTTSADEDDMELDVEDTQAFGKPQYSELDVIHNTCDPPKMGKEKQKEEELRRAVSYPRAEPHVIEDSKWSQNYDIQNEIDEIKGSNSKNNSKEKKSKEDKGESSKSKKQDQEKVNGSDTEKIFQNAESGIISTLKERLKDLEQQKNVKCLICLEPYTTPVVSTTCWHVHCEECWLVSMGVKKLCPQCNIIVCPTDLRRIYL